MRNIIVLTLLGVLIVGCDVKAEKKDATNGGIPPQNDDDIAGNDDDATGDDDVTRNDDDDIEEAKCAKNADCALAPTNCCGSCPPRESDYEGVHISRLEKKLKEMDKQCQNIACDECNMGAWNYANIAVCNEEKACEARMIRHDCFKYTNQECVPSKTQSELGCPSNWGDCGCTHTPEGICGGQDMVVKCEYDKLSCPIKCECVGVTPGGNKGPDNPEAYACIDDRDCIEVASDCCYCGGAAINKAYFKEWINFLDWERGCADVDCAPPDPDACEEGLPFCHYGRCTLKKPKDDWRCKYAECPIDCICQKDFYGCEVLDCVPWIECRSHSDCHDSELCWYGDGCALTPNGVECDPNGDGYCHRKCSLNSDCEQNESCYSLSLSYGDYFEDINVCLNLFP